MRVLILGFETIDEVDAEMEKLMRESECFLFSVVCGSPHGASYDWAIRKGAPVIIENPRRPQDLIGVADYLVVKVGEGTPAWMKNLVMQWKAAGKHGSVIRAGN